MAQIGGEPLASERLARCIATLGAGPGRSRPLDLAEAEDAFSILLAGRADPVQIGALMGLLNYRGVSPLELAGMVRACRRDVASGGAVAVDLDWPGYLSPFNRNPPWFLLAAKLLGQRGLRIVLHGFGPELSPYDPVLEALALPRADALSEAGEVIERAGVVFLPLPAIGPQIQALINLYPLFQMRMPLHLALQLLNPLSAPAIMMGLPRATLPTLHQEAAGLLGMGRLLSTDSHRDVAQATPHRVMTLSMQEGAQVESLVVPPQSQARPASPPGFKTAEYCAAVWSGQLKSAEAEAAVVDSAAMGLIAMRRAPFDFAAARSAAQAMWQGRNRELS